MSLNQIVQENNYVHRQNGKFKDTLTNTVTFDNNGQLKCETNATQNELVYRNEEGIYNPISNAKQRIYQQLSDKIYITTSATSLYDDTGAIGNRTIKADTLRRGSVLELNGYGHLITSSGNQIINFQLNFGATPIFNKFFTLPNLPTGSDYDYRIDCTCYSTGLNTNIETHGYFKVVDTQGDTRTFYFDENTDIDTTTDNIINLISYWNSSGNTLTVYKNDMYKVA